MTREDREIISEALNRICACCAAIATVLEGTEAEGQPRGSPENAEPEALSSGPDNTPEPATEAPESPGGKPPAEKAETPPLPACTYEEAREVLSVKAKNGYRAEVKALLTKHGFRQLSDVHDSEMFAILKAEAGDIGNG